MTLRVSDSGFPEDDYQSLVEAVREALDDRESELGALLDADRRQLGREVIRRLVGEYQTRRIKDRRPHLSDFLQRQLEERLFRSLFAWQLVEDLLEDETVADVRLIGAKAVVVVYASGERSVRPAVVERESDLESMIRDVASKSPQEHVWNTASPQLDMRLPSGHRLSATLDGRHVTATIRRHNLELAFMPKLLEQGMFSAAFAYFAEGAMNAKCNVVIAGDMGSGKTMLIRALLNSHTAPEDAIITIEESLELALSSWPDLHIPLYEWAGRREGTPGVSPTLNERIRASMRQAPDRTVLGEVRGEEIFWAFKVLSTGTKGSLMTLHAESAEKTIQKMIEYFDEANVNAGLANQMIGSAVDLIIHVAYDSPAVPEEQRRRRITEVIWVTRGSADGVEREVIWAAPEPGTDAAPVPGSIPESMKDRFAVEGEDAYERMYGGGGL